MIIKQKNKKSISGAKIFIVFEARNTIIKALTQNIRRLKKLVKNGNELLFYQLFEKEREFISSQEKDIKAYLNSVKPRFEEFPCRFLGIREIFSQFNDVEGEKYMIFISSNNPIPAHNLCVSLNVMSEVRQHVYFCTYGYPFHQLIACSKCNALFSYYKYTDNSCKNITKDILNKILLNDYYGKEMSEDCSKCDIRIHLFPKNNSSNYQKTFPVFSVKDLESLELDKEGEETTKRVFLVPPRCHQQTTDDYKIKE